MKVSKVEMQEALGMNRKKRQLFWMVVNNLHLAFWAGIFGVAGIYLLLKRGDDRWSPYAVVSVMILVFVGLYYFRIGRTAGKLAQQLTAMNAIVRFESDGIHEQLANGTTSFRPWSNVTRWKEGQRVFIIWTGNTYRTIGKEQIGDGNILYLRSMLQANVR